MHRVTVSIVLTLAAVGLFGASAAASSPAGGAASGVRALRITSSYWEDVTAQTGGTFQAYEAVPGFLSGVGNAGTNQDAYLESGSNPQNLPFGFPFRCAPAGQCGGPNELPCCPMDAVSIQVDSAGNAWWINSITNHIHYWVLGSSADVDLDAAMGDQFQWQSVGVGDPRGAAYTKQGISQVWAVAYPINERGKIVRFRMGSIYALQGNLGDAMSAPANLAWYPEPGAAYEVRFRHAVNPTSLCGSNWHLPYVRGGNGEVFEFSPGENNCFTGAWVDMGFAARLLGSGDVAVGADGNLYAISGINRTFAKTLQPVATFPLLSVGGQPGNHNVLFVTDSANQAWEESCGSTGC